MKRAQPHTDLVGLTVLTLLVLGVTLLVPTWHSPVRVVLGLAFVLVAPGYALTAALFPKKDDLAAAERLALCLGLSVAVVPLLGLLLNYTPWGIRLASVTLTLSLFVGLMAGLTLLRRRRVSPEERFRLSARHPQTRAALWGAFAAGFALMGVVIAAQHLRPAETFTEFYMLGPGGKLDGLPTRLTQGDTVALTLGVRNHEGETVIYRLRTPDKTVSLPPLEAGEQWEQTLAVRVPEGADSTKLQFDLLRGDARQPYRSLHLTVALDEPPTVHELPFLAPSESRP